MDFPKQKKILATWKKKGSCWKFKDKWLEMEEFQGWLEKSHETRGYLDLAICKLCDKTVLAHKACLMKHKNTKKHLKHEKEMGRSRLEEEIISAKENEIAEDLNRAEMNLYSFIAEHNLTVRVADCLVPLCKNIFPDSEIATKIASKRRNVIQYINEADGNNLHMLYTKLKVPGMFFSINMDDSVSTKCVLTVVFVDGENGVRYSFFDMFKVISGSTKYMYNSLKHCISSRGIPLENLVGFTSDTTNVMIGENSSVSFYLKKDLPDIACIKSSSHTIHLAASKACSKLPTHLENLLRNLGSHFNSSYGKQEAFVDFQQFFHVDIYKILSPATTMWLSVKECVDRVLEQYVNLQLYLCQLCIDDPFDTFQTILDTMKNPFTLAYLEFVSYILGILSDFNIMFQAEKPLLHKMKPEVEKLLKHICLNFLCTDYVKKTPIFEINYTVSSYFLPLDKIYLGVSASETINNLKQMPHIHGNDFASFFNSILNFYVELVTAVREEFYFHNELYDIISVVDPKVAQDFNIKTLAGVWKKYPVLKNFVNIQALDNEWKKHGLLDHHLKGLNPRMLAEDYWKKVFQIKNALGVSAFPNLYTTMKFLLVLPFFPAHVLKKSLEYEIEPNQLVLKP